MILDDVTYYQVVFTLPGVISELALANREVIADLLFDSAAASLRKTIRSQQGYDPASMMVLHTWNQQLQSHWHVHALVPGGGPSLNGDQWKSAEAPPDANNSDEYYLVDAISLREAFRKAALSRLKKLYTSGQLKLGGKFECLKDEAAWNTLCSELAEIDWVSFIQPPPTQSSTAEQVVRYLTRYLTGGPISDSRIIAADNNFATFLAREGARVGGERQQVPVTIPTIEFMRRWCLHIQPEQLTKTRYFGGWCCHQRKKYQATCRRLLGQDENLDRDLQADPDPTELACSLLGGDSSDVDETAEVESRHQCAVCQCRKLSLISQTPKPSWSELLDHQDPRCPPWYAKNEHLEFCKYLEREYGITYADYVLEMRQESTMSKPLQLPPDQELDLDPGPELKLKLKREPAKQLNLPGMFPDNNLSGYLIASF